jgi:hypothetical protein
MTDRQPGPSRVRPNTLSDERAPNTFRTQAAPRAVGTQDRDTGGGNAGSPGLQSLPRLRLWVWVALAVLVVIVAVLLLNGAP